MVTAVLRFLGGLVAGFIVAGILVVAVEYLSMLVHPFPADFDNSTEAMCRHVERYPHWVLAAAVVLWGATAFVSTWTAGKLGNRGSALVLGLLLLAAVILNISMLPYPMWFKIATLIVNTLAIAVAYQRLSRRANAVYRLDQLERT